MRRTTFLLVISLCLSGCATNMSNQRYFKDYINKDNTLKEAAYLCELDPHRPKHFITTLFDQKGLHYIIREKEWYSFYFKVCLDGRERLEVGNYLMIREIVEYNYFEGTEFHVFGQVYSPSKGRNVPFETTFGSYMRVEECDKPFFLMKWLGQKCKKHIEIMPKNLWDDIEDVRPNRIIRELNVY